MSRVHCILEHFSLYNCFVWGKNDCCLWAADINKAIHNIDYAKQFRGKYTSEWGFKKLLISLGHKDLKGLLVDTLGPYLQAGYAKQGDPVLLYEKDQYILGVCYGTYALFLTETGTTVRKLSNCCACWRL